MKPIDLFPPCIRSDCEQSGTPHKHILPMQQQVLDSSARFLALVGGYGSGKTLPAAVLGNLLSYAVAGNFGVVLRQSLPKLHDSTERIYLQVLERLQECTGMSVTFREMRDGFPHRVIYENGSEVIFRPTTEPGRFLGPEYGWYFLDEAQEEPEKLFKDLSGRLRLPIAGKYLHGILATNPPRLTHWIAKHFPSEGIWDKEIEIDGKKILTTWQMLRSSTRGNPFLDPEYVASIMATHDPGEAKRVIEGFYGFTYEGRPVYPQFRFESHVGDPEPKLMTLFRVWDFGFHNPACTWHQMFRCKHGSLHWNVLHELLLHELTGEQFALSVDPVTNQPRGVLHETQRMFGQSIPLSLVIDGGDAAGAQVSEKGPGPIIRLGRPRKEGGYNIQFRYKKFPDIDPGLDLVRRCLTYRCKCGYYLLTVHRRCQAVIEGLAGGYHYPKTKDGLAIKEKPVKDGYYDNPMDTMRYAGELFYRAAARDPSYLDELARGQDSAEVWLPGQDEPWAWMERFK